MSTRGPLGALALAALSALPVHPCAPAPPPGAHVRIAQEEALIVWDPEKRLQHFIRRADFESEAESFGFLVPTPAVPELAEADDAVFDELEARTSPRVEHHSALRGAMATALCLAPFLVLKGGSPGMPDAGLRIVKEQRVAGYDATVLQASDTGALVEWLETRGFAMRPALSDWLRPYVERSFAITAFRIARDDASAGKVATKAVRMTFPSDGATFPYREPDDQRTEAGGAPRLLRLYVVAPFRTAGRLEDGPWPGRLVHAKPLPDPAALLDGAVPIDTVPAGPWLNVLEDTSSPRPGTSDLVFAADASRETVERPPVIVEHPWYLPIPIDLLVLAGMAVWLVRRRRRRRLHTS